MKSVKNKIIYIFPRKLEYINPRGNALIETVEKLLQIARIHDTVKITMLINSLNK